MSKPIEISDSEFEEKVLKSEVPVLVDFWAPWCGPCRMVAPVLEELASEHAGELVVAKVNVDNNNEHASRYGVQGIPTMILFSGGEVVDRVVGAAPKAALQQRLSTALGAKAS